MYLLEIGQLFGMRFGISHFANWSNKDSTYGTLAICCCFGYRAVVPTAQFYFQ